MQNWLEKPECCYCCSSLLMPKKRQKETFTTSITELSRDYFTTFNVKFNQQVANKMHFRSSASKSRELSAPKYHTKHSSAPAGKPTCQHQSHFRCTGNYWQLLNSKVEEVQQDTRGSFDHRVRQVPGGPSTFAQLRQQQPNIRLRSCAQLDPKAKTSKLQQTAFCWSWRILALVYVHCTHCRQIHIVHQSIFILANLANNSRGNKHRPSRPPLRSFGGQH